MVGPVLTAQAGVNADLLPEVLRLYVPEGTVIADVTYGAGRFWRKVDLTRYRMLASDIICEHPRVMQADFRALPYRDASVGCVVFDPPYAHNSGTRHAGRSDRYAAVTSRYNGHLTTSGLYNADIMELYRGGLAEAFRVLEPDGGTCLVKCKDEVEREVQRWSHIRVYEMALQAGFCARDLFVLVPSAKPAQRWAGRVQRHAIKNHSFLWVFQRPDQRYRRLLIRTPPAGGVISRREPSAASRPGTAQMNRRRTW